MSGWLGAKNFPQKQETLALVLENSFLVSSRHSHHCMGAGRKQPITGLIIFLLPLSWQQFPGSRNSASPIPGSKEPRVSRERLFIPELLGGFPAPRAAPEINSMSSSPGEVL